MARYTDAVCKLCRREGKKLFLKGDRCYTNKCAVDKRSYAPGQHGQGRKKLSNYGNYGTHLRAKQVARRFYGVNESQFHKYFLMAQKRAGVTGENLLIICESRLDNVVSFPCQRQKGQYSFLPLQGRRCYQHQKEEHGFRKIQDPAFRRCSYDSVLGQREQRNRRGNHCRSSRA